MARGGRDISSFCRDGAGFPLSARDLDTRAQSHAGQDFRQHGVGRSLPLRGLRQAREDLGIGFAIKQGQLQSAEFVQHRTHATLHAPIDTLLRQAKRTDM